MSIYVIKLDYSNIIMYAKSDDDSYKKNNRVIVDNEGTLFSAAIVNVTNKIKPNECTISIVRLLNDKDLNVLNKNEKDSSSAFKYAYTCVHELELDMNFVDCYYSFDRKQLFFSFLSDNRVDFRELAKKLASKYKTRIELTQIGVRDKAKRIGGLGPCGLFLCCNSFLTDFNSVSINMAKNQMLALNPGKINGICGRLLCCLAYENDTYSELKADLPKVGLIADTPLGMGKVVETNILKGTYKVDLKENGIVEFNKEKNESVK